MANGVVYVGSGDNIYALNATTGTLLWSYTTGDWVFSSPAVANGVVYVGSRDGNVYALNASTGTLLWSYATGEYVDSSPAVANGVVYVGSENNNVYALNASTGTLLWSYTTAPGAFLARVANGVLYVSSRNVYALDATTGAKLWSYKTTNGWVLARVANEWFMSVERRQSLRLRPEVGRRNDRMTRLRRDMLEQVLCCPSRTRSRAESQAKTYSSVMLTDEQLPLSAITLIEPVHENHSLLFACIFSTKQSRPERTYRFDSGPGHHPTLAVAAISVEQARMNLIAALDMADHQAQPRVITVEVG